MVNGSIISPTPELQWTPETGGDGAVASASITAVPVYDVIRYGQPGIPVMIKGLSSVSMGIAPASKGPSLTMSLMMSVTLKSCGDASVTEPSVESSSRSMHGDGVRVRFPSSADVGDAGEFAAIGYGLVFGIIPLSSLVNRGNDKSISACTVSFSTDQR